AGHDHPIAVPQSGFLWDRVLKAGITFRNYVEWYADVEADPSKLHVYLAGHDHPIAVPQSGFLWDRVLKAGITFRNYGEWYSPEEADPSKMHVYLAGLKDHSDMKYRDDIG